LGEARAFFIAEAASRLAESAFTGMGVDSFFTLNALPPVAFVWRITRQGK